MLCEDLVNFHKRQGMPHTVFFVLSLDNLPPFQLNPQFLYMMLPTAPLHWLRQKHASIFLSLLKYILVLLIDQANKWFESFRYKH